MRVGLLIVAVGAACGAARPARPAHTEPSPAPAPAPSAPPPAPSAQNLADRLVETMVEYVTIIAFIPFDGDCAAWAKAALQAEPLVLRMKDQIRVVGTRPDRDAIKADVTTRAIQRAQVALEAKGMQMADYDALEQKVMSTCQGNPDFEAAIARVALKKATP
jgi:hypothetical protein